MPAPGGGVMLCPAYAPVPTRTFEPGAIHDGSAADLLGMAMSGMDMSDHPGHGGEPSRQDGVAVCPFGAAASIIAITHAPPLLAVYVSTPFSPQPFLEQSLPRKTIPTTRLPRGPPVAS